MTDDAVSSALAKIPQLFQRWDDIRLTVNCPHCKGTGMCDQFNECGFCTDNTDPTTPREKQ